jgi:GT2 family glycosyltransferase
LLSDAGRPRVDGKFFSRGGQRMRIQGVTYGPFAPNAEGDQFPAPQRVRDDFAQMRKMGVNSIRTYHLPPEWFLDIADEEEMSVLIDVPWRKHLCFLDSQEAQREARQFVQQAAERGREHPCVLAYSIGNEIPSEIVRWHGARRVERFIAELMSVAQQADADSLITYGNYPSTEYLDLSFLDFITFNVYLHDVEAFRRYLFRIQNLAGDKPLLLGEIGMDTFRHGEEEQAKFLAGHLREATLMGLAGAFVFAWTDDWFTGGYQIEEWAFGITRADRSPKASFHALGDAFGRASCELLEETPRVSVVVCSYNGASTLEQCLQSLLDLNYPDYEVILVDDGSTDNTPDIAARFPTVRTMRQTNQGLSVARNVGLREATGSIIAYTDSDCFADPDWLTHLVHQLQRSGAAAVGGPNLTPEDGWLAACIAASPGQPTHVLESDEVAEHIPGCNMAFRRAALEAIGGFDPEFRKAGDDVDVCWRLQNAGMWITFAPGAFVWHHRRQTPRTYLRQQSGYGEAEALLRFKHTAKFNHRGDGKWRGVMYGTSLQGLQVGRAVIHFGIFGTGLFQTLYQPGRSDWAMLPGSLEWHVAAALMALVSLCWSAVWIVPVGMISLSAVVALLQAKQARLAPEHEGFTSRLLITALCYVQPLVRAGGRYLTRLHCYRAPLSDAALKRSRSERLPFSGVRIVEYWTEGWRERTELLDLVVAYLNERGWSKTVDSGWLNWDIEVYCHPWTAVRIRTVQENHGSGKRLIRVRYSVRLTKFTAIFGILSGFVALALGRLDPLFAVLTTLTFGVALLAAWWRGLGLASQAVGIFDLLATKMRLIRVESSVERGEKAHAPVQAGREANVR